MKRFSFSSLVLFSLGALLASQASFALPYFSIEPVSLPTHITTSSSAVASYIITNNTGIALNAIGIKNLIPGVVSQDTTSVGPLSPAVCTNPITLAASGSKASCLLQIKVSNRIANWLPEVCDSLKNPIYCSLPKKIYELTVIKYILFYKAIYDDKACKISAGPAIVVDTGVYCHPYSYYDSQGVLFKGAIANIRCYKDRIVADNYPFSPTCDPKAKIIEKNSALYVGACKEAISHEGPVFEKLIGYKYPGNIKCIDTK